MATSAPPTPSPDTVVPASHGPRLVPAAVAVAVLAAVDVLVSIGLTLSLLTPGSSEVASSAAQVVLLVGVVVSALLAASVVLLVQRSARPDGRIGVSALIILGLLTLTLLLDPLRSAISTFGAVAMGPMSGSGMPTRLLTLGTQGFEVLFALAIGLLALLLALRSGAAARTVPIPGRSRTLAVLLCVLAIAAMVLFATNAVSAQFVVSSSPVVAALAGLPGLLMGFSRALLVPVGALLIAQVTAGPRRLTWIVLIVQWVSAIASILFFLLLVLQLELDLMSGSGAFMLWTGLSTVVEALAALASVVLTIVVLAQVRRHERVVAPTVQTP